MGWWADNAPTWLGGTAPKPPLPPKAHAAASRLQNAQQNAQQNLNPHPTAQSGCLPCQAAAAKPPCDLENFKVVEVRERPAPVSVRLSQGGAQTQLMADDEKDKRKYPATFPFAPKAPRTPPPYPNNQIIEFVGGDKKIGAKTVVTVSFDVPFKCGEHEAMEVVNPQGERTVYKGIHSKQFELEYLSKKVTNLARKTEGADKWELGSYWFWGIHPMDTKVFGVVCGVRKGADPWGTMAVTLRCWPASELELKLAIPSLYKKSGEESRTRTNHVVDRNTPASVGSSTVNRTSTRTVERDLRTDFLGRDRQGVTTTTSTTHRERGDLRTSGTTTTSRSETLNVGVGAIRTDSATRTTSETTRRGQTTGLSETNSTTSGSMLGTRTTSTTTDTVNSRGELTREQNDEKSGVVFYIKRSGEVLTNAFQGLKQILNLISIVKTKWAEIKAFLEKNKPKVDVQYGARFSFSFDLFSGELVGKWCWREWSDHRAYFYYGFELSLKIFVGEIDVNLGVGISASCWGITVELSAVIGVKGEVDFGVTGTLERPEPDKYLGGNVKIKGAASVMLYVKAVAGSPDWAQAQAAVKLPFEAEGAPKVTRASFAIEFSAKIKPTIASLDCHVKFLGSFKREREVFPEKVFFDKKLISIVGA